MDVRTTWWLITDHPSIGFDFVIMVRTWEEAGIRVDSPQRVFLPVDDVARSGVATEDTDYMLDRLIHQELSNETFARHRAAGRATQVVDGPAAPISEC